MLAEALEVAGASAFALRGLLAKPDDVGAGGGENMLDMGFGKSAAASERGRTPLGSAIPYL
ncbi:MAG TPA: hypothetical protein DGG94_08250 [Micromonosporaceae bacterium]|nr:hypothetical protein [Micromonosporaceae bacterium]HCU49776.1 hypothetical protein [Micromonosporaceae bacterium]